MSSTPALTATEYELLTRAEAAERALALHAGDTQSLSNDVDHWRDEAARKDAEITALRNEFDRAKAVLEAYEDLLEDAADEIERLRERCEAYKGQVKAGADEITVLRSELVKAKNVLRAYEQWEADLIMENKCWTGQNVRLTDELYERMIEIQSLRNAVLAQAKP